MHTGFIYKIVADGTDKVYYGSTTISLKKRFSVHEYDFKRGINCSSKELFKFPNARIELLETHHNIDKDALKQILRDVEVGYIERFRRYCAGRCVNKFLPNRTKKQYNIDNADKISEQMKQYRIDNADKMKKYRIDNADKISKQKKQYHIGNADKIKEYKKQYRIANADKLREQKRLAYLAKKQLNKIETI